MSAVCVFSFLEAPISSVINQQKKTRDLFPQQGKSLQTTLGKLKWGIVGYVQPLLTSPDRAGGEEPDFAASELCARRTFSPTSATRPAARARRRTETAKAKENEMIGGKNGWTGKSISLQIT